MSGQISIEFEQSQLSNTDEFAVDPDEQIQDTSEVDPIVSFLEKHGSTLIQNHEGQMVTVAEAMVNCPPFARLVKAMGEAALALVAPKLAAEEYDSEIVDKEDAIKLNELINTSEKQSKDNKNEDKQTFKIEARNKPEQLQISEPQKPKVVLTNTIPANKEVANSTQIIRDDTLSISTNNQAPAEIETTDITSQKVEAKSSVVDVDKELPSNIVTNKLGSKIGAIDAVSPSPQLTEIITSTPPSVDDPQPLFIEMIPEPAEAIVTSEPEAGQIEEYFSEALQVHEELSGIETPFQPPTEKPLQQPDSAVTPILSETSFMMDENSKNAPETTVEREVPVETVKQNIIKAADIITKMNSVEAETTHQVLNEIVYKVAKAQAAPKHTPENLDATIETVDSDRELKELFIQLFNEVGVEITQELVESCVATILMSSTTELSTSIGQKINNGDVTHDLGMHEAIKQLLISVGGVKKSVSYAYQIGKSTLSLYFQKLSKDNAARRESLLPSMLRKNKRNTEFGFAHPFLLLIVLVVAVIGFVGWRVVKNNNHNNKNSSSISNTLNSNSPVSDSAIEAGKKLSANYCDGTGTTTLTHLPMNADDFSLLIPYGVTIGGHVTPVDHQYFSPTNFHSAKDTYPVYAMADSKITSIEVHPPENGSNGRIRLVFTVSCTFFYYYDLVTSVEPGIDNKHLPINVKAGQLIGHIGGQTLDFAVWNTEKPLKGFINPLSYQGESWKIYVADPFPYYSSDLRKIIEAKDPRTANPIAGKIDYDIDGKLIGNWFLKDSGGYSGSSHGADPNYSNSHLSIAPDLYDPSVTVVSVGNYANYPGYTRQSNESSDGTPARQYFAKVGSPDPAKIDQNSGIVKIELVQRQWLDSDSNLWDNLHYIKAPKANNNGQIAGTILIQLTGKRSLKFEAFPGKIAAQISGFDSNAKTYTR